MLKMQHEAQSACAQMDGLAEAGGGVSVVLWTSVRAHKVTEVPPTSTALPT